MVISYTCYAMDIPMLIVISHRPSYGLELLTLVSGLSGPTCALLRGEAQLAQFYRFSGFNT